jgi:hypothetical protein
MEAKGKWGFFSDPNPTWLSYVRDDQKPYRKYYVAIQDNEVARGGYVLKCESALINGQEKPIASVQGPYSESIIHGGLGHVVFVMIRDMLQREPRLYGWGLERRDKTIGTLFTCYGWSIRDTPLLLWSARNGAQARPTQATCRRVALEVFETVVDDIWRKGAARYSFVVNRNAKTLGALYPMSNANVMRLMVERDGMPIGWLILGSRDFIDHSLFSTQRAAVLWDFFASPSNATDFVCAVLRYLDVNEITTIVVSTSSTAWIEAFTKNGFFPSPQYKRYWLYSPGIASDLCKEASVERDPFLTYADGDGWIGGVAKTFFGS